MGDALLTYENEAFFTNLVVPEKERLPFIVPDNNIRVRRCCCWGLVGGRRNTPLAGAPLGWLGSACGPTHCGAARPWLGRASRRAPRSTPHRGAPPALRTHPCRSSARWR